MAESNGAKALLDFSEFDTKTMADAGIEIEINNAAGDPTGLFFKVLGTDSSQYQKLKTTHERARVKKLAKGGKTVIDTVYDDARDNDVELVCACTIDWHSTKGDMPFPASDKDKLAEFYLKYPLVLDQVRVAIVDRANFTKGSVAK